MGNLAEMQDCPFYQQKEPEVKSLHLRHTMSTNPKLTL